MLACSSAPITSRRQLSLVNKVQMNNLAATQYSKLMGESKLVNDKRSAQIKRVGKKLSIAVEKFFVANPQYNINSNDFNWEFNLIEGKEVNAWCMPGGKVAFYTGILPFTQDDNGIAVVMGHEIAHAIAGHGAEKDEL